MNIAVGDKGGMAANASAFSKIDDRDPVAAARRVSIDEAAKLALENEFNTGLADIRDAAIWNTILLAKQHARSHEVTAEDVARFRRIRDEISIVATADGETVPSGFGPAVRTRQAAYMVQAAVRAGAKVEPQANGKAGDNDQSSD